MASQPRVFNACDSATALSMSQPPATQSVAEMRTPSGSAGGKATEDVRYRMKSVYVYERAAAPYISGETELPECD